MNMAMDPNLKKLLVAEKDLQVAEATIRSLRAENDSLKQQLRSLTISGISDEVTAGGQAL
jgi:SMC interacting uncharacterized protein involved in chromosome segregation